MEPYFAQNKAPGLRQRGLCLLPQRHKMLPPQQTSLPSFPDLSSIHRSRYLRNFRDAAYELYRPQTELGYYSPVNPGAAHRQAFILSLFDVYMAEAADFMVEAAEKPDWVVPKAEAPEPEVSDTEVPEAEMNRLAWLRKLRRSDRLLGWRWLRKLRNFQKCYPKLKLPFKGLVDVNGQPTYNPENGTKHT
jgi:hypothetical protein